MEIIVSGRHYQITPEFKDFAEKTISSAFDEISLRITNVRLVLTAEKEFQKADVIVGVKGNDIEASAKAPEMGKAISEAVDKAFKQAMNQLDKLHDRKKRVPVKESEVIKAEAEAKAEVE